MIVKKNVMICTGSYSRFRLLLRAAKEGQKRITFNNLVILADISGNLFLMMSLLTGVYYTDLKKKRTTYFLKESTKKSDVILTLPVY